MIRKHHGFTLLELLAAFSIVSIVIAVSVPAAGKMYKSMQFHGAVKEVYQALEKGRYRALIDGEHRDVVVNVKNRTVKVDSGDSHKFADDIQIEITGSSHLQLKDSGVIRFYPDGSSTGGSVRLSRPTGGGVTLSVGWLLGEITQSRIE